MKRALPIGVIMTLALLLRLDAAFRRPPAEALALAGDQRRYDEIAWNVASGRGFAQERDGTLVSTAFVVGPLYPLVVAVVYRGAGHHPEAVRGLQCLLGTLLCWILYRMGWRLFDQRIGLLTAGFAAVYPLLIRHSYFGGPAYLVSENLFLPLLALTVLMLVRMTRRPTMIRQIVVGICLGLAALTRTVMLPFPLALFAWLALLRRWSWAAVLRMSAVVTIVMGLTIAPWTYRNYRVFGQLVPVSTQGGLGFWYCNNPLARGGWAAPPLPSELAGDHPEELDELTTNRVGYQAGWAALRADPGRIPMLLVKKVLTFWLPFLDTKTWKVNWAFLLISLLALMGWWRARREPASWLPVLVPCGYLTAISMIFYGDPRLRAPIEPLLLVLAAVGMVSLARRLCSRLNAHLPV